MTDSVPTEPGPVEDFLKEASSREREQAQWYRALAARAAVADDQPLVDRLNDLHADEQHHLSRLTARLLELGGRSPAVRPALPDLPAEESWEEEARRREAAEVDFYQAALEERDLDERTQAVVEEILEGERHQARELGGKWMSA